MSPSLSRSAARPRLEEGELEVACTTFDEALDQLEGDPSFQTTVASGYGEGARRLSYQRQSRL